MFGPVDDGSDVVQAECLQVRQLMAGVEVSAAGEARHFLFAVNDELAVLVAPALLLVVVQFDLNSRLELFDAPMFGEANFFSTYFVVWLKINDFVIARVSKLHALYRRGHVAAEVRV